MSLEYLLILGIVFAVLIPVFYYSVSSFNKSIRSNQAGEMVNRIAETADFVYALGPGSQDTLRIIIPGGVQSIAFQGKEVVMKVKIFGAVSDTVASTKGNLTGSISTTPGSAIIKIKNENNVIQITD